MSRTGQREGKLPEGQGVPCRVEDLAAVITGMLGARWRLNDPGHPLHGHEFACSGVTAKGELMLSNLTRPNERYWEVSRLDGFEPLHPERPPQEQPPQEAPDDHAP